MTRIVLARHGETVWHEENRYAGSTDVPLTSRGLEQAQMLADWARESAISAIFSSPLSRARSTAEASAATTGLSVHLDSRLREVDFGRGEGLTAAEMRAAFPEERAAFESDPEGNALPGGEPAGGAADRFVAALSEVAEGEDGNRVLVIAHTTAIRLALCRMIGVPLANYRTLFPALGNCTLTEIDLGRTFALLTFNASAVPASRPFDGSEPHDHHRPHSR